VVVQMVHILKIQRKGLVLFIQAQNIQEGIQCLITDEVNKQKFVAKWG
jgi:hypothetical protein